MRSLLEGVQRRGWRSANATGHNWSGAAALLDCSACRSHSRSFMALRRPLSTNGILRGACNCHAALLAEPIRALSLHWGCWPHPFRRSCNVSADWLLVVHTLDGQRNFHGSAADCASSSQILNSRRIHWLDQGPARRRCTATASRGRKVYLPNSTERRTSNLHHD